MCVDVRTPAHARTHSDIAWTSAYPQITNMVHGYYGDDRLVARHWPSLVLYQESLISNAAKNPDHIAECDQFQDWLCGNGMSCCSGTPAGSKCPVKPVMGSFNYVLGLKAMAEMAGVVGNTSAAARYTSIATKATADFHAAFWNPAMQQYGGDAGAVQSLTTPALFINSPPANLFPTVLGTLQTDLSETTGYNPFVGAVTSKILLNVLSDNGLHETALRTATTTTAPSWGYWWSRNSSTCWESWPLGSGHGSGTVNHIFLCGGVAEWMWKHLVGLTATAPQFAEVDVHPKVHPDVGPSSASGSFLSPRGTISSAWNLTNGGVGSTASVMLALSLPVGIEKATVTVPKPFEAAPVPPATICAKASEGGSDVLTLSCSGGTVQSIVWAAWGTPTVTGTCSTWATNSKCNANQTFVKDLVEKACLDKASCAIHFTQNGNSALGDPCPDKVKTLAAKALCSAGKSYMPAAAATVSVGGTQVWDGKQLVGKHPGILAGTDTSDGVQFHITNGVFDFVSQAVSSGAIV